MGFSRVAGDVFAHPRMSNGFLPVELRFRLRQRSPRFTDSRRSEASMSTSLRNFRWRDTVGGATSARPGDPATPKKGFDALVVGSIQHRRSVGHVRVLSGRARTSGAVRPTRPGARQVLPCATCGAHDCSRGRGRDQRLALSDGYSPCRPVARRRRPLLGCCIAAETLTRRPSFASGADLRAICHVSGAIALLGRRSIRGGGGLRVGLSVWRVRGARRTSEDRCQRLGLNPLSVRAWMGASSAAVRRPISRAGRH